MSERKLPEDFSDFLEPSLRRLVTARLRGKRLPEREMLIDDAVEELKGVIQDSVEFEEVLNEYTTAGRRF